MGLSTPAARSEIQIDLPPVYYEGQTLTLSMPRKAGRSCAWFMNGDPVAAEPERNAIAYTFKDSGRIRSSHTLRPNSRKAEPSPRRTPRRTPE